MYLSELSHKSRPLCNFQNKNNCTIFQRLWNGYDDICSDVIKNENKHDYSDSNKKSFANIYEQKLFQYH